MIKVLFVCLGNICRSPMAQIIFENMIQEQGLEDDFEVDSAGTEGYNEMCHAGIHRGTKEVLRKNGVYFNEHYSRKIRKHDYEYYDYIIAMDSENISDIEYIVGEDKDNKIESVKEKVQGIEKIELIKNNEDGTKEYVIETAKGTDIRKEIFAELAKDNITIFEMKKADSTLEDAFMKLIEGGNK